MPRVCHCTTSKRELDILGTTLHDKMRALSVERQNRIQLWQKVKWALYESETLQETHRGYYRAGQRLWSNCSPPVPDGAAGALQTRGCLSSLTMGAFQFSKDIAKDQDKDLAEAISKALEASKRTVGLFFYGFL